MMQTKFKKEDLAGMETDKVYLSTDALKEYAFKCIPWDKMSNTPYEGDEVCYYVPFCSYGDYDNSTEVERSNHRVFLAMHGHKQGLIQAVGRFHSHVIIMMPMLVCELWPEDEVG